MQELTFEQVEVVNGGLDTAEAVGAVAGGISAWGTAFGLAGTAGAAAAIGGAALMTGGMVLIVAGAYYLLAE